ncbi:hypothetical protein C8F04DRAFT_1349114 [Mycena alexandri]|uniref:Nephrocystin 3-like N-terminal domain-containing protein n=1 Tax=Mycena alexandri TaxID=1745969 RepID=A0AAD6SVA6_9AGAR|nr:hypothetical protein C8F04DRAFT_1349114 [Mycena alexandri]
MSPDRRGKALDVGLDIATPVLELAESALALVPVPGLSLVAKGLSTLVDRVKDARENDGARRAFLDQVEVLETTLSEMVATTRTAVEDAGDEHAKKALVDELLSVIQGLEKDAEKLKGGPGVLGFFKGIIYSSRNKATLSDMKDSLASAIGNFTLQGQFSIENILIQIAKGIEQRQKEGGEDIHLSMAEEQRILDSFLRADAGYRCVDELKSGFLPGTREELFEELTLWSTGNFPPDEQRRFYFLSGGAGLGKSSIAHQFCKCLDTPDETALGASFFFLRGGGDLESTRLFFSTLAHQLALSQPTLRPHIIGAAREYLRHGGRQQMEYAYEGLLKKTFCWYFHSHPETSERDLVPSLLKSLLKLIPVLSWLRVFVTSRPEPHIMSELISTNAAAVVHHRSLDDTLEEWADDVGKYLKETLSKMPRYSDFVWEQPSFLERLIKRAGGVFIYARIAVRFLDTYWDPQEQFELLLSPGGTGLSSLDALYLQILSSAFPPEDLRAIPSRHTRLHSFLTIIALQQQPLTPEVMVLLGRVSKEHIVGMTDQLRSVLLIDNKGCVVPLHATFGEFLRDPKRCIDPLYYINPSKGHAQLASTCITAFTLENVSRYLTDKGSPQRQRYVYYARYCWYDHLVLGEYNDELKLQLMGLIGAPMPLYTRIGGIMSHSHICSQIQQWLIKGSKDSAEITLAYVKSAAYSRLWWERILHSSRNLRTDTGVVSPNISAEEIHPKSNLEGEFWESSGLDLTMKGSDIVRYRAVHEEVVKQIWDAGVQEVWFNPKLN